MDLIFQLPLCVLAVLLSLVAVLLLLPKPVSLPLAALVSKTRKNPAGQATFYTVCLVLGFLLASSALELARGAEVVKAGGARGSDLNSLATIDYLRAQVACVLSAANLLLAFVLPALAEEERARDHAEKNLDAMKRQVKGLQTEYERVTKTSDGAAGAGAGGSEADALKKKVDKLIQEKNDMQATVDAATKAKGAAEARVEALLSQIKGFDKEYDRVLDENKALQQKLAAGAQQVAGSLMSSLGLGGAAGGGKKDM